MAKQGRSSSGLDAIAGMAKQAAGRGPPPVHLWNPPFCGDLDMRIASDGTWYYLKTPIGRPALVKLFASVLKREGERYYLVTPVEKCGISVDDAPFLAVELRVVRGLVDDDHDVPAGDVASDDVGPGDLSTHAVRRGPAREGSQILQFRTNVDDWVGCGAGHALRFEPEPSTGGLKPYLD